EVDSPVSGRREALFRIDYENNGGSLDAHQSPSHRLGRWFNPSRVHQITQGLEASLQAPFRLERDLGAAWVANPPLLGDFKCGDQIGAPGLQE
ncbi:MAG: hypothetical protein JJT90_13000, partial [Ectothiorhodospiraceae bacterium]|nr:hypothetical protein [Ectothiorhodospiraceae bacterium]